MSGFRTKSGNFLFRLFLLALWGPCLVAQTQTDELLEVLLLQRYSIDEDSPFSDAEMEDLGRIARKKINLNDASDEDLSFFFNDFQRLALRNYQERFGNLYSPHELYAIQGMDSLWVSRILPFLEASSPGKGFRPLGKWNVKKLHGQWLSCYKTDFRQYPTETEKYQGGNFALAERLLLSYERKIQLSLIAENDIGEPFFSGVSKQGFDHYSGHLSIGELGMLKQLIIGDYRLQFGQGLTLWQGFSANFLSEAWLKKQPRGLLTHQSFAENGFMRGVAAAWEWKEWTLTGFYSNRMRDCALGLQETGLHRTANEIKNKQSNKEQISGANISWNIPHWHVGTTFYHVRYGDSLRARNTYYNKYAFRGKEHWNWGADMGMSYGAFLFYGEFSVCPQGGAGLGGVQIRLPLNTQLGIHYHYYAKNYQNLYSRALGGNSLNQNEQGWVIGLQSRITSTFKIKLFAEGYEYPWKKYRVNKTRSQSFRTKVMLEWNLGSRHELYTLWQYRLKEQNMPGTSGKEGNVQNVLKHSFRVRYVFSPLNEWRFATIAALTTYAHAETDNKGYVIAQDLIYQPDMGNFSFSLRYALFSALDYNSACYIYERDIPYSFSVPAYYRKGHRVYGTFRYDLQKKLVLWTKFGVWLYAKDIETKNRFHFSMQLSWEW